MNFTFLGTYRFYIFVLLFSLLAVYWSFTYVKSQNVILFRYAMWFLFIFYVLGFLLLGGLSLYEIWDQFVYARKFRRLEAAKEKAVIKGLEADSTLTLFKASEPKSMEAPPLLSQNVLVDLSEQIKVKPVYPLIETIVQYSRILVVGGQGSGKTSIMLWLAAAKKEISNVVVIDTHASPNKWPEGSYVLGFGLDYEKATMGFDQVFDLMSKRYQAIGEGKVKENSHPRICLLSDEWTELPDIIPNFKRQYVKPLFTKSRKSSVDLSLAAHADTAEALGMQGIVQLKKSFEVVVYCDKVDTQYNSVVQYGTDRAKSKRIECMPPGPYIPNSKPFQPITKHVDFGAVPGVLSKDVRILDAIRDNYDDTIMAAWKQTVRKSLGIPASPSGYQILDDVATRYNLVLK
jgi:hypothetical protein